MRYADIVEFDVNNGDGIGMSLFVQGCPFHCKGCFNQETWDFKGGKQWTSKEEERLFKLIERPYIQRISILGGEPLCKENRSEVWNIINKIRILFGLKKKIWVFSGYTYEDLKAESDNNIDNILDNIDVLVDGRFVESLKDVTLAFRGSSNQRIIRL